MTERAKPTFQPSAAQDIQGGDALGHADRMVVGLGQQNGAMSEPDLLGALAGRREHQFRRGAVRQLLQSVMLDREDMRKPGFVGQLDLIQHLAEFLGLLAFVPRLGHLDFIHQSDFHAIVLLLRQRVELPVMLPMLSSFHNPQPPAGQTLGLTARVMLAKRGQQCLKCTRHHHAALCHG